MSAFRYDRIKQLPGLVRALCFNLDAWVVGSGAKFLCGKVDSCRDWDVIIPPQNWQKAAGFIPPGSTTNTFGGIKVSGEVEVDMWADDLGTYFMTMGHTFDHIAVSPKTQQVCECTKRI